MDARRLAAGAQEDLRRRVVYAVREDGMGKSLAARTFGVSRQSIDKWLALVEEQGPARGLAARERGPKPRPRLAPDREREAVRLIRGDCPDQLLLPFALWTGGGGRAVGQAVRAERVAVDGRAIPAALGPDAAAAGAAGVRARPGGGEELAGRGVS